MRELISANNFWKVIRFAQFLSAPAIGDGGLGSNPGSVKSAQCRQRLAIAATFLWSCVAQTLSRGIGLRHTLRRDTASIDLIKI